MSKKIISLVVCISLLSIGSAVFAAQPPTANAGPELYVASGNSITLQGYGSDPQNLPLSYYWTCNGGTLSSSTDFRPYYTAPIVSGQTTYTCTLTVTNTAALSATDTVTIYVNANNAGSTVAQTNSATNIANNQATLNGYFTGGNVYNNYVWFQWGTDTNYSNATNHQALNSSGSFAQNIVGLNSGTIYHFRAVAQNNNGTFYGQDMTFNGNGSIIYGNGTLTVTKKVLNLSSGNLSWQASVNAAPGDVLSFAITMQAGNQDIHNVMVRDILPSNLIYLGNMTVNASLNYSGSPVSGINIGTIPANGIAIISYQAKVAPTINFDYGTTTLNNNATITSTEGGSQTASAGVVINNSLVSGALTIDTGLTNNPIRDSFFLPMALIILGSYLYFSGNIYRFADWIETKI